MLSKEPTLILKFIEEVIRALVPMALIFGWVHWSEAQTGAVMLFVGVVIGGLAALVARSQTVPAAVANEQIKTAVKMPANTSVEDVIAATKENSV